MIMNDNSKPHRPVNRAAYVVLIIFALALSLTTIKVVIWGFDGPRYTHRMWFEDRMDRINEDQKIKDELTPQIDNLRRQLNEHILESHTRNEHTSDLYQTIRDRE